MDGHVLTGIFDEALARRPDAVVDTPAGPGAAAKAEPALPADIDEKLLEHLRSLGYIGP